jgi:hypothetical protein
MSIPDLMIGWGVGWLMCCFLHDWLEWRKVKQAQRNLDSEHVL